MVASIKHPKIHIREINGQPRDVPRIATARIYSRPKLLAQLDWLLTDEPEYDMADDPRDLDRRIGQ
jgi:hypothetical protein